MLRNGNLVPFLEIGDFKKTDISLLGDDEINYIKDRLALESQSELIARYAHILYSKAPDNRYAKKAIPAYRDLGNQYLNLLSTKEKNILDFIDVAKAYITLSILIKHELDECRDQIINWYSVKAQDQFYYRCLNEIFASSKLFKKDHLLGYTKSALEHFVAIKCAFEAEDYLESCLLLAKKEGVNLSSIYVLMAENQLKLAEKREIDATGIIRADCYLKAAKYYKDARELSKSNNILRQLDAHKKNIKLTSVSTKLGAEQLRGLSESITLLAKYFLDAFPETFFIGLAIDNRLLPSPSGYKQNPDNNFLNYCRVSSYDININTHILSDLEKKKRDLFIYVKMGIEMTIPFLIVEIVKQMKTQDRDFVQEGLLYFKNTWFRNELQQTILSEEPKLYEWMTSLQPAIEILLKVNIEEHDSLLTPEQQMAFDQLAIKFEGLLRDLCQLADITTTKVRDDQTVAIDINGLLQSEELQSVFEKKDIELWQYTFTGCGYNIRNNVAHTFYRPHNYTVKLSNILLVSYVRLAKYGNIVLTAMKK